MDTLSKSQKVVQELFDAGAIQSARALKVPMQQDGYHLFFYNKKGDKVAVLEAQRGNYRVFKTLDAVASLVVKIGLRELSVAL